MVISYRIFNPGICKFTCFGVPDEKVNQRLDFFVVTGMICKNDLTVLFCKLDNLLVSGINDWVNNVPRWILKGNTSNHAFLTYKRPKLEERPPQLIMGPNARKAGINISQEELNKIWEDEFQPPKGKEGRNAPCLCGSGKKYKNCCLKSN